MKLIRFLTGLSPKQARQQALRFGEAVDRYGRRYDAFGAAELKGRP